MRAGFGIGSEESWETALAEIEARGGRPNATPAGASDHPLGGHGFASWVLEVARAIGVQREPTLDDDDPDERYHGGVHGIPDEATIRPGDRRPHRGPRTEGMVTDPVDEGESMAATIDRVGRREIDPSSTVLHAHLGGRPALNGCSALFS